MAIEIISLKCPKCSSPLSGFENDWIFFCPVCSLGWDFSGSKPESIPVSYARAKIQLEKSPRIFYLPFYLFQVSIQITDAKYLQKVKKWVDSLKRIYLAGFRLIRESYFGDLGFIYTESMVELEPDANVPEKQRAKIGAVVRTPKELEKYLILYPSLILDKRADITGIKIQVDSHLERIWAVPFFDLGEKVQEGILGKTFPSFALEEIEEFRKIP